MRDKLKGMLITFAAVAVLGAGGIAIAGAAGGGGSGGSGSGSGSSGSSSETEKSENSENSEKSDKNEKSDKPITGAALDQASAVALKAVGAGKVTQTEADDEEGAYEVEVTRPDGSQVDVHLSKDFKVLSSDADHEDSGQEGAEGNGETND